VHFHAQLRFPLLDQRRNDFMQQGLMPFMHDLRPLGGAGIWAHREGDAAMVDCYARRCLLVANGQ
jgi:hypothetical protein